MSGHFCGSQRDTAVVKPHATCCGGHRCSAAGSHPGRSVSAWSAASVRPVCRFLTGDTAGSLRCWPHPPRNLAPRGSGETGAARSHRVPLHRHCGRRIGWQAKPTLGVSDRCQEPWQVPGTDGTCRGARPSPTVHPTVQSSQPSANAMYNTRASVLSCGWMNRRHETPPLK